MKCLMGELILELPPFGDVVKNREHAGSAVVHDRNRGYLDREMARIVRAPELALALD
jgi:hypothetical protein